MHDITKSIIALAVTLAAVGVLVGGASAITVDNWDGSTPVNDTFTIDNETESLRVYAENVTNDTATAYVWGVENGTVQTEVTNTTISTDATNGTYTTIWEYSNISTYDTYKVNVTGDGADQIALAKVNVVRGGGGGGSVDSGGLLSGWLNFGTVSIPGVGDVPGVELAGAVLVIAVVGSAAAYERRE